MTRRRMDFREMDHRVTPANGRVAAESLRGKVRSERYVAGEKLRIATPLADLLAAPGGARERQLAMGERVLVLERRAGWAFVFAEDGPYAGYLPEVALGPDLAPTHRVIAASTHLYDVADLKSPERAPLCFGAMLTVTGHEGRFSRLADGSFVPGVHLAPIEQRARDRVAVAELFLGTPYLWGGDSRFGIDCAGLVHEALRACDIACPRDSDLQFAHLGTPLAESAPLLRGDLLFWAGHVAMVADSERLIHANAHHMAVAHEPIDEAIARIERQGDGPVIGRRRLQSVK